MRYDSIMEGRFISRPNRFIAHVEVEGQEVVCHVKNTGRCRELLPEGARVYLEAGRNENRKTPYSLVAVRKGDRIINMDSQAPNKVFKEALLSLSDGRIRSSEGRIRSSEGTIRLSEGEIPVSHERTLLPGLGPLTLVRPEKSFGDSRFDFYLESGEQKAFVEVKGVTLEEDGVVKFPDAPTERGIKHVLELAKAVKEGYLAYIVMIIQMDGVKYFTPNDRTHPEFGQALRFACGEGVRLLAYECHVWEDGMELKKQPCEVRL